VIAVLAATFALATPRPGRAATPRVHAIVGARIVTAPGHVIPRGTIVMRDGVITAVGANVPAPADARVWPGDSLTVYAGLIDPFVLPAAQPGGPGEAPSQGRPPAQTQQQVKGLVHPLTSVRPENRVVNALPLNKEQIDDLRAAGFAVVQVAARSGIFRGQSAVIGLGDGTPSDNLLKEDAAQVVALEPQQQGYPGSLMGTIAVIRQGFLDAKWYRDAQAAYARKRGTMERPDSYLAWEALQPAIAGRQATLFVADEMLEVLRAAALAREAGLVGAEIVGAGDEYKRAKEIAATHLPLVVPVNFPEPPDVSNGDDALEIPTEELRHWQYAPGNAAALARHGVTFALTTNGLKDVKQFRANIAQAIARGLTADQALAAVTVTPAQLLGLSDRLGTIAPGKIANLTVTRGDLFGEKSKVREIWTDGNRYEIPDPTDKGMAGTFSLQWKSGGRSTSRATLIVAADKDTTAKIVVGADTLNLTGVRLDGSRLQFANVSPPASKSEIPESADLTVKNDVVTGTAMVRGANVTVAGGRQAEPPSSNKGAKTPDANATKSLEAASAPKPPQANVGTNPEGGAPTKADMARMRAAGDTTATAKAPSEMDTTVAKTPAPSEPEVAKAKAKRAGAVKPTGKGASSPSETSLARGESSAADSLVPTPIVMGNTEPWRMPQPPQPAAVLVRHATIWTAGPQGIVEDADMLVRNGTIAAVGKHLAAPSGAIVIDATGKAVAPGIIDCHSHSAILGNVNECTNSVTAEVRIQDVINSESINIYRQLASGATMMHLLHGSCNAIGGQCAVIKNKWGLPPDQLFFAAAPGTIKFALGENPKQSNWGNERTNRYPQSRGGVEQTIRDAFIRARDYKTQLAEWRSGKQPLPRRRDLQLDALVEILDGTRYIHCHSYRQDEILMLIRLGEELGFRVGTFQHVLEGYKVADEMAKHGAAGSTFSDWWAYKYEVIDAIPYNGYLMWDRGVTVSYNSDSDEQARRLNTEAAKAVKYGGVPPAEAIKFVTLNAAKQLHIENRVGSIEVGKDADFAIWSGSPLSPYSVCEQTWIEGRKYFDRAADLAGREPLAKERAALIAKARAAKKAAPPGGGGPRFAPPPRYLEEPNMSGNDCGFDDVRKASGASFISESLLRGLQSGEVRR
jgi:N-acetylglucosamine-6-phosphate deacetylase